MTSAMLTITPLGKGHPDSEGEEVVLLGYRGGGLPQLAVSPEILPAGWDAMEDVNAGPDCGRLPLALRGTGGSPLELECGRRGRLALLTHPWSGRVRLQHGDWSAELDLYSERTAAILVDVPTGKHATANRMALERMRFIPASSRQLMIEHEAASETREGELIIRATGRSCEHAADTEVVLLHMEPFGYGVAADLQGMARHATGWKPAGDVTVSGNAFGGGIKSTRDSLTIDCDPSARLILLRHAWSGIVEIVYRGVSTRIDLYAAQPSLLSFRLDELASIDDDVETLVPDYGDRVGGMPLLARGRRGASRRELYERLSAHFDVARPVALFVPRWHGAAASTKALFEQVLPVPEGATDHPDDITEEDIVEYAECLVATGCRHFVVSGGDVFNLAIIDEILKRAPETRFDQLWHSNFLQMGEPHDWNLLRHWLHAMRDGTITRIGVVKEGLEHWFHMFGLDAVFIPNVVPIASDAVCASGVTDRVGIWLSGSSSYRKLPHASLLALKMLPEVTLTASGLDPHAMAMIRDLQLPYRTVSAEPLPHRRLMRAMAETGLTLYVTVSECSPMLPLESFSVGVPCLVGPASHLFRRNDTLREALVVQRPHSPAEIAEKARHALGNQEALMAAYLAYHAEEEALAQAGMRQLLA